MQNLIFKIKKILLNLAFMLVWLFFIMPPIYKFIIVPLVVWEIKLLRHILDVIFYKFLPMSYGMYDLSGRSNPIILKVMDETAYLYLILLTIIVIHLFNFFVKKMGESRGKQN